MADLMDLVRPLKMRRFGRYYSSGPARDFHALSVRDFKLEKQWMRLLEHLVEAESCSDDDSDDETDVVVSKALSATPKHFSKRSYLPLSSVHTSGATVNSPTSSKTAQVTTDSELGYFVCSFFSLFYLTM
jgi:hypothetical protein